MSHTFETQFGGRTLTIETGKIARLAGGAVTVTCNCAPAQLDGALTRQSRKLPL